MISRVLPLLLCLVLAGCDLFSEEDTVIRASGTVVLTETGEPLEGLSVALISGAGGFGGRSTVTTTRTDAEGHFSLRYVTEGARLGYDARINTDPFNPNYTGRVFAVVPGETHDLGVIELEEIGA